MTVGRGKISGDGSRRRGVRAAFGALLLVATVAVAAESNPAGLPSSVVELRAAVDKAEKSNQPTTGVIGPTAGQRDFNRRYQTAVGIPRAETVPRAPVSPTGTGPVAPRPSPVAERRGPGRTVFAVTPSAGNALALPVLAAFETNVAAAAAARSRGVFDHFADEPFLEQLELRVRRGELGGGLQADLEAYLAERDALTREIVAQTDKAPDDAPALAALGARQSARLDALEAKGEDLRRRLASGNLVLGNAFNADAQRPWHITAADLKKPREKNRGRESQAARLAAYFAGGLSPAQRRLLREAALEFPPAGATRRAGPAGDGSDPRAGTGAATIVGFLPEQSLLALPGDLPAEVRAELKALAELKRALQQELLDAVYFNDERSEGAKRELFAKLASAQAPRIAELERRTEAVRPALAALPGFRARPAASGLPEELRRRIAQHRADAHALEVETQHRLADAAVRRPEPPRVLRLHTGDSPAQCAQVLGTLALFEGRHAVELEGLETGGAAATATDRELGRELRKLLAGVVPAGEPAPRFRFSCDTAATTDAQRGQAREQFAAVWERRRDLTAPLEREAARLQGELASADAPGVVRLLADLQAHWHAVEAAARALSFDLGLVAPRETDEEWQRRRDEAGAVLAREQRARRDGLAAEERAIRRALADSPGNAAFAERSFDELLSGDQENRQAAGSGFAAGTYRRAVLMPGLLPAQRRLLLGLAVVELRRSRTPSDDATVEVR